MDFPSLLAAADRAALAHLGSAVRYVAAEGDQVDVVGVFDNAAANAVVQGQEVASAGPRVFLRLEDLPTDPEREPKGYPQVVIGDATYATRELAKDGQGGVILELAEVP